jgi:hypothetical protein
LPGYEDEPQANTSVKQDWSGNVPVGSVVLYSAITLVVIVALFLVLAKLGSEPQVQISVGTRPAQGWEQFTDDDKSITFYIPLEWDRHDGSGDNEAQIDALASENRWLIAGTVPLGNAVDDLELAFVGLGPTIGQDIIPAFMVVATSKKLNRLSYEDAEIFLDEGEFTLAELRFIDNFDRSHLSIITENTLENEDIQLRCQQQFVKGEESGMLVSMCAPSVRYTDHQSLFEEILNHFQRLT